MDEQTMRHNREGHATVNAGVVHAVTGPDQMTVERWGWCPICQQAYRGVVVVSKGHRWTTAERMQNAARERQERIATGALLRELSGGSGIIPASAHREVPR